MVGAAAFGGSEGGRGKTAGARVGGGGLRPGAGVAASAFAVAASGVRAGVALSSRPGPLGASGENPTEERMGVSMGVGRKGRRRAAGEGCSGTDPLL
jgi:hypothetical protein